jgi:nucleoside-diphosphate-sugar epimerase
LAAEAEGVDGEIFNVARGGSITINNLLELLIEITGADVAAVYQEPRPGDVRHSRADITKAQRLLGYVPRYGLRKGLEETVKWFQEHLLCKPC